MQETGNCTLHTLHTVAEDRNGVLKSLHSTLHTLHRHEAPARPAGTPKGRAGAGQDAAAPGPWRIVQSDKFYAG